MRVWLVPAYELSDRHLVGQHREIHLLISMIGNSRFASHPAVMFYREYKTWVGDFHHRLVCEMKYRFSKSSHQTPVPEEYQLGPLFSPPIPPEWVTFDQEDLSRRHKIRAQKWTREPLPTWAPAPSDQGSISAGCYNCERESICNGPKQGLKFCERWVHNHSGFSYQMQEPIPLYKLMREKFTYSMKSFIIAN
jgi:hypothetical protein